MLFVMIAVVLCNGFSLHVMCIAVTILARWKFVLLQVASLGVEFGPCVLCPGYI